jgi:hypothetical protein
VIHVVRLGLELDPFQKGAEVGGGPSKAVLALARLLDAHNRFGYRPANVYFAAWYPSKALIQRMRD